MDDMSAKIQEILSDEESMKQLNELAQMFSASEKNDSHEQPAQSASAEQKADIPDFDFSMIFKLQEIMNKTTDDKTSGFLIALKPLLRKERQEKVDKAVKILRLLAVWDVLKESGLLNNFLK